MAATALGEKALEMAWTFLEKTEARAVTLRVDRVPVNTSFVRVALGKCPRGGLAAPTYPKQPGRLELLTAFFRLRDNKVGHISDLTHLTF